MLAGAGIGLGLRGKQSNAITLPAGTAYIPPAGTYIANLGPYTSMQFLDPVTGIWRTQCDADIGNGIVVQFDGANQRLANLTGCPVAAIITSASCTGAVTGIGATATTITVTSSSGSSTWAPVIGGAISLTCLTGITGATVGAGYLYPPTVLISAPPVGGLQATAHCTVTGGTLLAAQVTIDNQGAGYLVASTGVAAATITFVNDPRDTVGAGVSVRLAVTGTGQLTGLYPLTQGVPLTGVPTLAFSTGVATATVVMNFTVTSFVTGVTGVAWATGGQLMMISSLNALATGTIPIWTNPIHEKGATFPRPARITIAAGSTLTTTGALIEDGGFGIQGVPTLAIIGQVISLTGALTGVVFPTAVVGGVTDTSWLQPI